MIDRENEDEEEEQEAEKEDDKVEENAFKEKQEQRKGNESEEEESELDLRNYLRDDVLETVDECLTAWEKGRVPTATASDPLHRCVVCTLPHGTCEHTRQWLETQDRHSILDPLPKDNVDLAIDDIEDVLSPASTVPNITEPGSGVPLMSNLRWETLRAVPADYLSGDKVDLSCPPIRAGHTMVLLNGVGSLREDTRLLVVFGGVSVVNNEQPTRPHSDALTANENSCRDADAFGLGGTIQQPLLYHADVRVFRVGLGTWHCPNATGNLPDGRYGHVSVALDGETMWMFGGRLQGGRQAGDTYILNVRDMRWERICTTCRNKTSPAPRVWSAAVKDRKQVLLYGGADIHSGLIFDDIWTWNIQTRHWSEQIVVGTPPLARYGHALLACPNEQVLVLGGCCVSSQAEAGLPTDHDLLQLRVRVAANKVNSAYRLEEAEIAVGAFGNFVELGGSIPGRGRKVISDHSFSEQEPWKNLSRRQAQLAAAIAARERDTALREEELRAILHEQAATTYWATLNSRHPMKKMDVAFLDVEGMMWRVVNPPAEGGVKSTPPVARMQFAAAVLGQKVVLWGGCLPTSKRMEIAEGAVHVFDLVHRRWSTPVGDRHPEGIQVRISAAVGQLRRAERALFKATQRAMTLGVPGGRTLQVVQAEAVVAVNRWRVQRLENEIRHATPSPLPRAAHVGCAVGHRVMYFGGWGAEDVHGQLLVLDIEQVSEKERRLQEEFHLRLERERQEREAAEAEALQRLATQERMRNDLELAREAADTAAMAAEDARSAIPELTIAPTPRLRCANSTTLWLEWDRPAADAIGNAPDERVEYTLYMRGGFREWSVGDHVRVEYLRRAQRRAAASDSITTLSVTDTGLFNAEFASTDRGQRGSTGPVPSGDSQSDGAGSGSANDNNQFHLNEINAKNKILPPGPVETTTRRLLPAVITDASVGGGLFDIRWDDGQHERRVRRYRIHRPASPPPAWTTIYKGCDSHYAVEGMMPESVIHRERGFPYEVGAQFSLQTKGTEVPREKFSIHSPVVFLRTKFEGQGPLGEERGLGKGGASAKVRTRLNTAKELDDSITAGRETTHSSMSGVHPLHGQYVATGRGRLYL